MCARRFVLRPRSWWFVLAVLGFRRALVGLGHIGAVGELFAKLLGDATNVKQERVARLGREKLGTCQPTKRFAKGVLGG